MSIDYSGMSDADFAQLDIPVEGQTEKDDQEAESTTNEQEAESTDTLNEESIIDGEGTEDNSDVEEGTEEGTEDTSIKETLMIHGVETDFTTAELKSLAEQKLNSAEELTEYHTNKPILNALSEQGLLDDPDRMNLLIEAGKGNPVAIRTLMEVNNIDPLTLGETPDKELPQHIIDVKTTYLNEVITELSDNADFDIVSKSVQTFDEESKQAIIDNPDTLRMFTEDVKDGKYQKVLAEITKQTSLGLLSKRLPKLEQYSKIYLDLFDESQKETAIDQPDKAISRKTPPKGVRSSKRASVSPHVPESIKKIDFLGMSDADFLKLDESKY